MGKELQEFKTDFNQFEAGFTNFTDFLNQGFTNKLFNSISDKKATADSYYRNNSGILKDQFDSILRGPKYSDRDHFLEWINKNLQGLVVLENEDLCSNLADKGLQEIRTKTADLRRAIRAWIDLYKNNMDKLINPDGSDNFSNTEPGSPNEKAKQIQNVIEVFCAIPNRAKDFLWDKDIDKKRKILNEIIDSKERQEPIFDAYTINEIASENPNDAQIQLNCMKAMKKVQQYHNSDPLYKAFAKNPIGDKMIKSVIQRGESILKQQDGIESFEMTTPEQDTAYINKLINSDIRNKNINLLAAIESLSVISNKYDYSGKNEKREILVNCEKALNKLLPLEKNDEALKNYISGDKGYETIAKIIKKSGLAVNKKAEIDKRAELLNKPLKDIDYFRNLKKDVQKASGTFHDSPQYKNFRSLVETYVSLAESIKITSDNRGQDEKFELDLDELSPAVKSFAVATLGDKMSDYYISSNQTGKLMKKLNDEIKVAAKLYEEYKMKDHTLYPDKEPGKKLLNKDDITKLNLVREFRDLKPLPEDLYKAKRNNIQKEASAGEFSL